MLGPLQRNENITYKETHHSSIKNYLCIRGTSTAAPSRAKLHTDANTGKVMDLKNYFNVERGPSPDT